MQSILKPECIECKAPCCRAGWVTYSFLQNDIDQRRTRGRHYRVGLPIRTQKIQNWKAAQKIPKISPSMTRSLDIGGSPEPMYKRNIPFRWVNQVSYDFQANVCDCFAFYYVLWTKKGDSNEPPFALNYLAMSNLNSCHSSNNRRRCRWLSLYLIRIRGRLDCLLIVWAVLTVVRRAWGLPFRLWNY